MARTPSATQCTPTECRIAHVLGELGYSWRRIGLLLDRTDKTARAAAARGAEQPADTLTARQEAALRELHELHAWLDHGKGRGFLDALAAWLGSEASHANHD